MNSSKKPSIILLGPSPDRIGGVATHIDGLMNSGLKDNFNIHHLKIGRHDTTEKNFQSIKRVIFSNLKLYKQIKSKGAKLVHINASMDSRSLLRDSSFVLISKLAGAKVFLQFHGGRIHKLRILQTPSIKWFFKKVLLLVDKIAVRSEKQKKSLQKVYPSIDPLIIPNFINPIVYQQDKRRQMEKSNEISCLFVGRVIKEKGIFEIIQAFRSCLELFPNLRLRVAGTGDELSKLKNLCERLELEGKVNFLGFITGEEKVQAYLNSDIFLLPTYWPEGFPYVIVEAMAAGLPIIASPSGAIPEVIEDGVNGFLVPPKEPTVVAEKLNLLLEDTELRGRIGKNNLTKAKTEYSWDRGVQIFTNIYRQLL